MTRLRIQAIAGAAGLVLLGVALGVAIDRLVITRHPAPVHHPAEPPHRVSDALRADLHLTDVQVHAIDSILAHHQGAVTRAWETMEPRVLSAVDSAHRQIESVLDTEQIAVFRHWVLEQHERHAPR